MTTRTSGKRFSVRRSPIHGRGVYALVDLRPGEALLHYGGQVITWAEANERYFARPDGDDSATYYFDLGDGTVIDGAVDGNDARFLNHSCRPNCTAEVVDRTVRITTSRAVARGEELLLDYALEVDHPEDPDLRVLYRCNCAEPDCRSTMLRPTA